MTHAETSRTLARTAAVARTFVLLMLHVSLAIAKRAYCDCGALDCDRHAYPGSQRLFIARTAMAKARWLYGVTGFAWCLLFSRASCSSRAGHCNISA
jgi:hypothetical protein